MSVRRYLYIQFPLSKSNKELHELLQYENTPLYVLEFRGDIKEPIIEEVSREQFNELINN